MRKSTTIHSIVKKVAISWCKNNRKTCLSRYFTEEERAHLAGSAIRSVAGLLALKRALVALYSSRSDAGSVLERSFIVRHLQNGSPCLATLPPSSGGWHEYTPEEFSVSIAHTRTTAYGMAAVEERTHA